MVAATTRPSAPSREEYGRRTGALRRLLDEKRLDAAVVFSSTMRPGPLHYLTGYTPTNGFACLHISGRSATLLTDQAWDLGAMREGLWLSDHSISAPDDLAAALGELSDGARRIGVIGGEILPVAVADALRTGSAGGNGPLQVELADIGDRAAALRMVKSEEELALLREACRITSIGAATLVGEARPGASELELAASIEAAMRSAGSGPLAFPLVLGAGAEQTACAVPLPGERLLRQGDLVLLDCGATFRGYCGDMARTLVVGAASGEQQRLLDTALAIFERCAGLLRPGVIASQIHAAATAEAAAAGFELPFLLGHGIGCQNWEPPLLDGSDATELEPGMVITLEPGLYVAGLGGVRLEDTFLITRGGAEPLTDSPMNLWEP